MRKALIGLLALTLNGCPALLNGIRSDAEEMPVDTEIFGDFTYEVYLDNNNNECYVDVFGPNMNYDQKFINTLKSFCEDRYFP
tara:strand:- start:415 stop:663 length:249 start_codon:yes stop_codon:yes gene_type:complete